MPASPLTSDQVDWLDRTFTYHKPTSDQVAAYGALRRAAYEHAVMILALTPDSAERDVALEKVSEASMWANAAVARNE